MFRDATSAIDVEHSQGHALKWLHFSHCQNVTLAPPAPGSTVGPWAPALGEGHLFPSACGQTPCISLEYKGVDIARICMPGAEYPPAV